MSNTIKTYHGHSKQYRPKDQQEYRIGQENFNRNQHSFLNIPSASTLADYSEDASDRIFEMYELEQNHRHELENKSQRSISFTKNISILLSFLLSISILFAAIYLVSIENDRNNASLVIMFGFGSLIISKIMKNLKKRERNHRNFKDDNKFKRNFKKDHGSN